jgi:hypothetical protein
MAYDNAGTIGNEDGTIQITLSATTATPPIM